MQGIMECCRPASGSVYHLLQPKQIMKYARLQDSSWSAVWHWQSWQYDRRLAVSASGDIVHRVESRGIHGVYKILTGSSFIFLTHITQRTMNHRSLGLFKTPIWIVYQNLTAMASRTSLFNRRSSSGRSSIGELAHESAVYRATTSLIAL